MYSVSTTFVVYYACFSAFTYTNFLVTDQLSGGSDHCIDHKGVDQCHAKTVLKMGHDANCDATSWLSHHIYHLSNKFNKKK